MAEHVQKPKSSLTPIDEAEQRLGLPKGWLKVQAAARQIPHLRADDRYYVHLPTLEAFLVDKAIQLPKSAGGER